MLKISEFSRLTGVPKKTLRYYDDIGLFQPAFVDPDTGYRFYDIAQLPRLNRILSYKNQGFSLTLIAKLLDDALTPEQVRGLLRQRQRTIRQRIDEEQERLTAITDAIDQIVQEDHMYEVTLKRVEPVRVASLRGTAPDLVSCGAELHRLSARVFHHIKNYDAYASAPGIALYHDFTEHQIALEFAQPINGDLPDSGAITVYMLPGIEQAATVEHHNLLEEVDNAHQALMAWMEANDYQLSGPPRDVYLRFTPDSPSNFLTEIQYPVARVLSQD